MSVQEFGNIVDTLVWGLFIVVGIFGLFIIISFIQYLLEK